jgi:hypothetical protein
MDDDDDDDDDDAGIRQLSEVRLHSPPVQSSVRMVSSYITVQ